MVNIDKIIRIEWEDKRCLIRKTNLPTYTMIFFFNTLSVNKFKLGNNHQTFYFIKSVSAWKQLGLKYEN